MNLGRPISLLIVILIAFGYMVSDDQHVRRDLKETRTQLSNLNAQVVDANEKLAACVNTVQSDQQLISQLTVENTSMKEGIASRDSEINALRVLTSEQSRQIAELQGILASTPPEQRTLQSTQPTDIWPQFPPIVLAAIVAVQLIMLTVHRIHKKGYVKLSREERALIIKMRRMKKT